jgi:hypothetical protein
VEPTLNFTSGGCSDDPTNSRTNCNGAGISGLSIAVNGTTQATQPALNFNSGTGITQACVNNAGANRVDCTPSLNTAVALTIATAQAGKPDLCSSSNGTSAYTCTLSAASALTAYTAGMHLTLSPDTTNIAAATLNVDTVGVKNIKQSDGVTDPSAGQIVAGRATVLYFDGTVWRLPPYSGVGTCDNLHAVSGTGNCIATAAILGSVALASQTASVASINLIAGPAAGMYRVVAIVQATTAATSGSGCSLGVTIGYTDSAGATTSNAISGLSLTALGRSSAVVPLMVASGNITYSTTRTAGTCSGDQYALNIGDGSGKGKFRGGFGVVKDYRISNSNASFTSSMGRSLYPCWGIKGGGKGTSNYFIIEKKNQQDRRLRKVAAESMQMGDVVSLRTGGGGGFGDPMERDPEKVLNDVVDGYITVERAKSDYGVAIDENKMTVDSAATKELRSNSAR